MLSDTEIKAAARLIFDSWRHIQEQIPKTRQELLIKHGITWYVGGAGRSFTFAIGNLGFTSPTPGVVYDDNGDDFDQKYTNIHVLDIPPIELSALLFSEETSLFFESQYTAQENAARKLGWVGFPEIKSGYIAYIHSDSQTTIILPLACKNYDEIVFEKEAD